MNKISFPEIISPLVKMNEPNEPILIHKGNLFLLRESGKSTKIDGKIQFEWIPKMGLKFTGDIHLNNAEITKEEEIPNEADIKIGNINIGTFMITKIHMQTTSPNHWKISGVSNGINCIGDATIPVDVIRFEVCNLNSYIGQCVSLSENRLDSMARNRLGFNTEQFTITLDQHWENLKRRKVLKGTLGYLTLYSGELKSNKKPVDRNRACKYLKAFNFFLYFLNGRRVSAMFLHGIGADGNTVWKDYSSFDTDPYKNVDSWSYKAHPFRSPSFNDLWNQFYTRWQRDEETQEILKSIVHWYVEANNQSGRLEGAIILAQAALELLFNWISAFDYLKGNKRRKNADDKIRFLVEFLEISPEIPDHYKDLKNFIAPIKKNKTKDGPSAVTFVRNTFTHSHPRNIKHSKKLECIIINQALQLSLYYIELSMLNVLKYKGKFFNRTNRKIEELDYS